MRKKKVQLNIQFSGGRTSFWKHPETYSGTLELRKEQVGKPSHAKAPSRQRESNIQFLSQNEFELKNSRKGGNQMGSHKGTARLSRNQRREDHHGLHRFHRLR
jgi:hypothetical protein